MDLPQWCSRRDCLLPIHNRETTASPKTVARKKHGVTHWGHKVYEYGICPKHHRKKLRFIRTDWNPCEKCNQITHKTTKKVIKKKKKKSKTTAIESKDTVIESKNNSLQRRLTSSEIEDELQRYRMVMERRVQKRMKQCLKHELDNMMDLFHHKRRPQRFRRTSSALHKTTTAMATTPKAKSIMSSSTEEDQKESNFLKGIVSSDESDAVSHRMPRNPRLGKNKKYSKIVMHDLL